MRRWSNDLWPLRLWQTDGQLFRQWPGVPGATGDPPNRRPDLFLPPLFRLSPRPNPSSPSCHLSVAVNTLAAGAASRPFLETSQPFQRRRSVCPAPPPPTNQPPLKLPVGTRRLKQAAERALRRRAPLDNVPGIMTHQKIRHSLGLFSAMWLCPHGLSRVYRLLRHPVRLCPDVSTLLLMFDDVIISFRRMCALLLVLPCRICQSEKTCSLPRLERCLCSRWAQIRLSSSSLLTNDVLDRPVTPQTDFMTQDYY